MGSKASDLHNALPFETRDIVSGVIIEHHIRDLNIELNRLESAYRKHRKVILDHLRNVEKEKLYWERRQAKREADAETIAEETAHG